MAKFERANQGEHAPPGLDAGGLRLALAGGGTGGHILPGLHLLDQGGSDAFEDVLWFQTGRAVESQALEGAAMRLKRLAFERVLLCLEPRSGGAPSLAQLSLLTAPATLQASRALRRHKSQVLLGLGGFTSLPAVLAARSLGIPIALFEINAAEGKATKWLAPLARTVAHAWPQTLALRQSRAGARGAEGKTLARHVWTGPPLASGFQNGAPTSIEQRQARERLGFDPLAPLVLILGGSQGASSLNRFVARHIWTFAEQRVQVLHQTGPSKLAEAAQCDLGYRAVEFLHDVPSALQASTLVLCRGGASTLAEIAALARPAWVVPYPHHHDRHQEANARMLGRGARLVPEAGLNLELALELARTAGPAGESRRMEMSAALDGVVPKDGALRLLDLLEHLARRALPPNLESARPTRPQFQIRPA